MPFPRAEPRKDNEHFLAHGTERAVVLFSVSFKCFRPLRNENMGRETRLFISLTFLK